MWIICSVAPNPTVSKDVFGAQTFLFSFFTNPPFVFNKHLSSENASAPEQGAAALHTYKDSL